MGIGQVISDTFGVVKERFGTLLGLWAVYFGIIIVMFVVFGIGLGAVGLAGMAAMGGGDAMGEGGILAMGAGMIVFLVLFYLAYILVAMAQYASLISVASPLRQANFSDALSAGWRAAPALLMLMIVLIVGYVAAAMVFSLVAAAFSALGDTAGLVLSLLLVPVLAWLGCRLAPLFAVVAVDGVRNPFTAIGRSWHLTRGHALTIFLASLVFFIILLIVCGLLMLPSIGLLTSMADPAAMAEVAPAFGSIALLFLSILVVSALFAILYSAFMAVIHGSLSTASGEGVVEAFA